MRKFIVSDIHGLGNLYYSIMGYLDNISRNEEIELYINGDLIDRGLESAEILLDVIKRIKDNKFKITYLGGNHELMMYQEFERRKQGIDSYYNDWYLNGGYVTDDGLNDKLKTKKRILEVVDFISNLDIYHKFKETVNNKQIVLVHAACPSKVLDKCNVKIKDDDENVFFYTWTREDDIFLPFRCRIGNDNYFTIVGHTPNDNYLGYEYHEKDNYLNIDGGATCYAKGFFEYNHFPLVEICDDYLKILTFNDNNEIVHGNYFYNNYNIPFTKEELIDENNKLNKNIKIKKLSINEDGIVGYWK